MEVVDAAIVPGEVVEVVAVVKTMEVVHVLEALDVTEEVLNSG